MTNYVIHMDQRFAPLELMDVSQVAAACQDTWWNQTLTRVNDSLVRLGVFHGEFHWHKHDHEDELFYVVSGELLVDLQEGGEPRTVRLAPTQAITVPRGVVHRTRAPERTVVLM